MKLMWSIVMVVGLAVSIAGAACGKDEGGKTPTAAKPQSGGDVDAPDTATVKAIDCPAVCTAEAECIKKSGIKVHETHDRDCTQGCEMLKGLYDPARHGQAMARYIRLAAGKCD